MHMMHLVFLLKHFCSTLGAKEFCEKFDTLMQLYNMWLQNKKVMLISSDENEVLDDLTEKNSEEIIQTNNSEPSSDQNIGLNDNLIEKQSPLNRVVTAFKRMLQKAFRQICLNQHFLHWTSFHHHQMDPI